MTGTITLIARTELTPRELTATSRSVTDEDTAALARLLREAYGSGTVGTQEDAETTVRDAFRGEFGPFLQDQSQVIEDEDGNRGHRARAPR